MNITVCGILFCLLLLVIPLYTIYYFRLNVMHRFVASLVVQVVAVIVMALLTFAALKIDSILFDVFMLIALSLLSAVLSLQKARLKVSRLIVPVGIGSLVATAILSFYILFLVFGQKNPFVAHLFMPVAGIVAGGMIGVNAKALQAYYSGLLHHGQLYDYLIGNGSSHSEALRYLVRRCLQSAIVTSGKFMTRLGIATSPLLMFALVMCGTDVLMAAIFQILLYLVIISASLISIFISLYIGRRYSFDDYERLKPVTKQHVISDETSPSDSSSSPSTPLDTDFESRPQAE